MWSREQHLSPVKYWGLFFVKETLNNAALSQHKAQLYSLYQSTACHESGNSYGFQLVIYLGVLIYNLTYTQLIFYTSLICEIQWLIMSVYMYVKLFANKNTVSNDCTIQFSWKTVSYLNHVNTHAGNVHYIYFHLLSFELWWHYLGFTCYVNVWQFLILMKL